MTLPPSRLHFLWQPYEEFKRKIISIKPHFSEILDKELCERERLTLTPLGRILR